MLNRPDVGLRCRALSARLTLLTIAAISLCAGLSGTAAASERLIRVSDGIAEFEGRIMSMSGRLCTLMDRQGKLVTLDASKLRTFERVAPVFRPHSISRFRTALLSEFGSGFEVAGSQHYLVCGPRGRADRYAKMFEEIYRDVWQYFRVRGFDVADPDVPLVAVVFPSRREFLEYAARDKAPTPPGLLGYYSLQTNRVAMFDEQLSAASEAWPDPPQRISASDTVFNMISQEAADTIVHEATHQISFNTGVHSRVGTTPVWIVEGLATALEPRQMRQPAGRRLMSDRINNERFRWFMTHRREQRSPGDLAAMISRDGWFHKNSLNGYAESWAFTFFLLETPARRSQFVRYLKQQAERSQDEGAYPEEQRVRDFEAAFGDVARLELEFIRFMNEF